MFNCNKGQSLVGIIITLVIVGLFVGGAYYYFSRQIPDVSRDTDKLITDPEPKTEIALIYPNATEIPTPPEAKEMLSAFYPEAQMASYVSADLPEEVEEWYHTKLKDEGWQEIEGIFSEWEKDRILLGVEVGALTEEEINEMGIEGVRTYIFLYRDRVPEPETTPESKPESEREPESESELGDPPIIIGGAEEMLAACDQEHYYNGAWSGEINKCYEKALEGVTVTDMCKEVSVEDVCYLIIALQTDDLSVCDQKISSDRRKADCYEEFAIRREQPELCDQEPGSFHRCYENVAIALKDPAVCERISEDEECVGVGSREGVEWRYGLCINKCYFRVAEALKDSSLCNHVGAEAVDACYAITAD